MEITTVISSAVDSTVATGYLYPVETLAARRELIMAGTQTCFRVLVKEMQHE